MQDLNSVIATLQQDGISIEAKQNFLLLWKDILLAQRSLDMKSFLAASGEIDVRSNMEQSILKLITPYVTSLSEESKTNLTSYLGEATRDSSGVDSDLLALRLKLLAKISPFEFVNLLNLDIIQKLDLYQLIQVCRDIILSENAVTRKHLILNLRKLLYSESKTDHQGRERIITLSVHAFVALYPRFQSIYDLEEHFQRRTKSGALKTSLISEIVQWVEQKPDWVQSRVEVILQLTAELETLVEKFKKAHSPDAFKELVKYVAALIPPGEVFLYALDETHVLDCLAGTTRVDQPRILVREDPILAKNIEVGNAVLNNYDDEVSYFRTVIPLVMIGKLEPTTIGAIIIKTASEIEFSDLLFLSILLPRISRSALELIAIDRERKLTDLNVGLDYLQHQFRKPANNISDLLKLMSQMPEIIKTEKLKQRFETLRLMSDYSIFTSKRIESSIELDRGTYVLQVDQLDLLSLVREILEMLTAYHYPVREKSKKITLLHSSPCVVPGDAYLIKLAAGELIENAMRYAMEEITLKVVQNETYGFIEVSDDGKRSERDEKRYFKEPFSSEQGGTGKGLPFVKRVAEKHEGTYGYVYRDTKVFFIGIPKHSKLTESE